MSNDKTEERAAFEAWATDGSMLGRHVLDRQGDGYWSSRTQLMWDAWQARAALSSRPMQGGDVQAIVKDIHDAIAELAGVARYPDLTEAIDQLAALSSAPVQPVREQWQPIETAPKNMDALAVVRWLDKDGQEHHDLDHKEDDCWQRWHDHAEHVEVVGGYVSYTAPYTHWMPLPAAPSHGICKE